MARRVDLGGVWDVTGEAPWEGEAPTGPLRAPVPGRVCQALEEAGMLAPLASPKGLREREWVFRRTWTYRRTFETPDEPREGRSERYYLRLRVAGRGAVELDGQIVGAVSGPWMEDVLDVTDTVAKGGAHQLAIRINQPMEGAAAAPETGILSAQLQCCAFGRILRFNARGEENCLKVSAWMEGYTAGRVIFHYRVLLGEELVVSWDATEQLMAAEQRFDHAIPVPSPRPWRIGEGQEQPVYAVRLMVERGGTRCDSLEFSAGFTQYALHPPEGGAGALPYAAAEGERSVFLSAAQLDPPFSVEHIRQLAKAGVRAVRFGGALPPTEEAYDWCDRLGLLVWQELPLFGPAEPPVQPSAACAIAGDAAGRLAAHPCAAVISGGRELQWPDGTPAGVLHPTLARMREVVEDIAPWISFFPTSPSGPVGRASAWDAGRGLRHDAIGPQAYHPVDFYQAMNQDDSLLPTDVGAAAPQYWADAGDAWRDGEGDALIALETLMGSFGTDGRARYLQLGRFLQGQMALYSILSARSRAPRCAGLILRRANMPYPAAASPALMDFDGRERPALGAMERAMAPVAAFARLEKATFYRGETIETMLHILAEPGDAKLYRLECKLTDVRGSAVCERTFQGRGGAGPCGEMAYPLGADAPDCLLLWLELYDGELRLWREAIPLAIPREGEPLLAPLGRLPRAKPAISAQEGHLVLANDGPDALMGLTVYQGNAIVHSGALLPWEAQPLPIDPQLLGTLRIEALNV